ncbi:hypothetical protein AUR64_19140 [Haloprofundus marisrubri]|uniref:Uncharacterized protein n=1 Tax=Haloprofundus marisrubri TaxID=1514971 RepID=A0A0W1R5J1_9EURY|nr:hypothetical protein [Haloprofundus marisrubri]KTG08349.1 hypothetical protein AUR64_19140 [Haloprofundus marisrubri]
MAKVSVGLRGWRFEESEIFTDEGEFKPLDDIPEDPRQRLLRLSLLVEKPCQACYLVHGEENVERCRQATIVYGEPLNEVVLCDEHEADFLYWFREAGGREFVGDELFRDEFQEWFADGGRAPDGYGGMEHVDTDPDSMPSPPDAEELHQRINEEFEGERINLRDYGPGADDESDEDDVDESDEPEELDLDGVDLGQEYPRK